MKLSYLKPILITFLVITACGQNQKSDAARSPDAVNDDSEAVVANPEPAWQKNRLKKLKEPMEELTTACALTEGAALNPYNSACECSNDQDGNSRLFVPTSAENGSLGGTCASFDAKSSEADDSSVGNINWSLKSGWTSFFLSFFPLAPSEQELKTEIENYLANTQQRDFKKIAAWNSFMMPGFAENVSIKLGTSPLSGKSTGYLPDEVSLLFEYSVPAYFNKEDFIQRASSRLLYSSDVKELPLTIGALKLGRDFSGYDVPQVTRPPAQIELLPAHKNAAIHALAAYNTYTSGSDRKFTYTANADSGCLGFCTAERNLILSAELRQAGVSATEKVILSQGTEAHHLIVVKGPENVIGYSEAIILLNRGGTLSLMMLNAGTESNATQQIETKIFNSKWEELTPAHSDSMHGWIRTLTAGKKDDFLKLRSNELDLRTLKNTDAPVVTCEDQFHPQDFEKLGILKHILVGPKDDSLYGWTSVKTQPDELESYVRQGQSGWTSWENAIYSMHAVAVTKIMSDKNPNIRAIPISSSHCTKLTPSDIETFNQLNAKVINFSYMGMQQEGSCRDTQGLNAYSLTKDSQLWVFGSGNDGTNMDGEKTNWICPQSYLSGKENALIVAATQNGQLWRDSDVGAQYADIVVDGSYGKNYGTSFAAPRVSALAATIFKAYPNLTPKQVRLAILLGADIPKNEWGGLNPFPVRSGGTLNSTRAMAAAKIIAKGNQDTSFILKNIQCTTTDSFECGALVRKQKSLLIKNRAVTN